MNISKNFNPGLVISKLLGNNNSASKPKGRYAGVLVPFVFEPPYWKLLFTQRTQTVNSHKGQISFPGGMKETSDKNPEETALREAKEEIGLKKENVRILGQLEAVDSIGGYRIYPIVGEILKPFAYIFEPQEVESIFTVPIDFLFDPSNWSVQDYSPKNGATHKVIFFKEFENHLIWGITAKIITDLATALEQ